MTSTAYRDETGRTVSVDALLAARRRVSWGAIFVGALLTFTVALALNVLGIAIGTNMINVSQGTTPSASSFGIGSGLWLLAANLIALAIGAYAAGRLSGVTERADAALHGLAVWALSTLITVLAVGSLTGSAVSSAGSGLSSIVGGAASGIGQLASAAGAQILPTATSDASQTTIQQLIDRARLALTGSQSNPSALSSDQRKAEIGRLIGQRISSGNISQQDGDRLAALVAAEGGISTEEAKARIQDVERKAEQNIQQLKEQAKQAADTAAKAAAIGSYWVSGTLLLGAIIAVLAASLSEESPSIDRRYS